MVHRIAFALAAALAAGIAVAQSPAPGPQPQMRFRTPGPDGAGAPLPALPDTEENRLAILERLAATLEENFVFPDIGGRYAAALRTKATAGGYAGLGERFGETVTADLQAIHPDRHLRFGPTGPRLAGAAAGTGARRVMRMPDGAEAIGDSGWIAEGVGYINLTLFPGDPAVVERVRAFMEAHRGDRAIIFDIRRHRGGGLAEMDVIFSYLFARETLLVGMDTRTAAERNGGNPLGELATLRDAAAPESVIRRMHFALPGAQATPLRDARIYVLTSRRSGSAAEHFALAMKRTGRATLIGEPTAGAGHYGRVVDFGGYAAFVPVGRTYDPDTNQGWEGTGVAPNVEMPADQALDEALRRLGVTAEQRRPLA